MVGQSGLSDEGGLLDQYVNDRPYVASSFLSVASSDVFASARPVPGEASCPQWPGALSGQ
jgi:hypothetical protein